VNVAALVGLEKAMHASKPTAAAALHILKKR
jgi:hypothetical protein